MLITSIFSFSCVDFFLGSIKSHDCLGGKSNVEKKKQNNALVESHIKVLFFENMR